MTGCALRVQVLLQRSQLPESVTYASGYIHAPPPLSTWFLYPLPQFYFQNRITYLSVKRRKSEVWEHCFLERVVYLRQTTRARCITTEQSLIQVQTTAKTKTNCNPYISSSTNSRNIVSTLRNGVEAGWVGLEKLSYRKQWIQILDLYLLQKVRSMHLTLKEWKEFSIISNIVFQVMFWIPQNVKVLGL